MSFDIATMCLLETSLESNCLHQLISAVTKVLGANQPTTLFKHSKFTGFTYKNSDVRQSNLTGREFNMLPTFA